MNHLTSSHVQSSSSHGSRVENHEISMTRRARRSKTFLDNEFHESQDVLTTEGFDPLQNGIKDHSGYGYDFVPEPNCVKQLSVIIPTSPRFESSNFLPTTSRVGSMDRISMNHTKEQQRNVKWMDIAKRQSQSAASLWASLSDPLDPDALSQKKAPTNKATGLVSTSINNLSDMSAFRSKNIKLSQGTEGNRRAGAMAQGTRHSLGSDNFFSMYTWSKRRQRPKYIPAAQFQKDQDREHDTKDDVEELSICNTHRQEDEPNTDPKSVIAHRQSSYYVYRSYKADRQIGKTPGELALEAAKSGTSSPTKMTEYKKSKSLSVLPKLEIHTYPYPTQTARSYLNLPDIFMQKSHSIPFREFGDLNGVENMQEIPSPVNSPFHILNYGGSLDSESTEMLYPNAKNLELSHRLEDKTETTPRRARKTLPLTIQAAVLEPHPRVLLRQLGNGVYNSPDAPPGSPESGTGIPSKVPKEKSIIKVHVPSSGNEEY